MKYFRIIKNFNLQIVYIFQDKKCLICLQSKLKSKKDSHRNVYVFMNAKKGTIMTKMFIKTQWPHMPDGLI